jgi:hypothetical protein
MAQWRDRMITRLANIEEMARVRLHQAANRMQDDDPIEVGAANAVISVLDKVDRLTHFRAKDRDRKWPDSDSQTEPQGD